MRRASAIFDEVIVAVLVNRSKTGLFTPQERQDFIHRSVADIKNVRVDSFNGLLVDYMRQREITTAIRGLRAVSDLEYEFQLAHTNRMLYPEMETVFLMPSVNYVYLSSTTVREVAMLGGELDFGVPAHVEKALREKYKK
jgi:pantetheine-phosphate adenylyltransferase